MCASSLFERTTSPAYATAFLALVVKRELGRTAMNMEIYYSFRLPYSQHLKTFHDKEPSASGASSVVFHSSPLMPTRHYSS